MRALLVAGAMLFAATCSHSPSPSPEVPRNVVLISIDTLRADRMSLYGAERNTTPAIDALAKDGVAFTRAYSPAPWTLPAHAAMLTGRYPSSLSSESNTQLYRLAPALSSLLKQHGYATAAVTGGGFVSEAYGAQVGFDAFRRGTVDHAVQWIEENAKQPFFLFFHTYVAHQPYLDTRYVEQLDGGRLASLLSEDRKTRRMQEFILTCGRTKYSQAEKEFLLGLYDGGVAAADEMVGEILGALRERGLLERTIVLITSDHGEEFWDHGERAAIHGHTLYNELLRVPLIWYEPGLAQPGKRPEAAVSLVDIVPTLLSRLGFTSTSGFDGADLSPLLEGRAFPIERPLLGEAVRHGPPRQSLLTSAGKLIVNEDPAIQLGDGTRCAVEVVDREELYLPSDPAETRNRIGEQQKLSEKLAHELAEVTRAHAAAAKSAPAAAAPSLDEETRKRLEALGYVD